MTKDEWEKIADQVLTRGVQKTAGDILISRDSDREALESQMDTPPGFLDEPNKDKHDTAIPNRRSGGQTKNQGPKRYGDPIKHSVRLICSEDDITNLNKTAWRRTASNSPCLKPKGTNAQNQSWVFSKDIFSEEVRICIV